MRRFLTCLTLAVLMFIPLSGHAETDVEPLLKKIQAVGPKGKGHREAIAAVEQLGKADASQLTSLLAGMNDAGPLATNWIRAAVETVAQRSTQAGGKLPVDQLEQFLANTENSPRARRLAYELLIQADPTAKKRWVAKFRNDPSLELRRESVAKEIEQADSLVDKNKAAAVAAYRKALDAARDIDQIKAIAKAIQNQGADVDLPRHFGFVMRWHLIAPFDNVDMKGFNVAYQPEKEVNLAAKPDGKDGQVSWTKHVTKDEFGNVDLNTAIAKHKGAICYAYAEFFADKAQDVELRLGCINANKLWLNGKLLTANEVYHARTDIDQYVGKGRLKKGRNTILLKVCQNEQEERWAQDWKFQLRVCDEYGTGVLSTDRPSS